MSRLFNHFNNLLPGTDGEPATQVASAIYVTHIASQDDADVSQFTGEWWSRLPDSTKAGLLAMTGFSVLKEAFKPLRPEEAALAVTRSTLSLPREDQRDLNA